MKHTCFLCFAVAVPIFSSGWFVLFPSSLVIWIVLADHWLPDSVFDIHTSPSFQSYHSWLADRLPEREPLPIAEMTLDLDNPDFDKEFARVSQNWRVPVVIRGAARETDAYKHWHSADYWTSNWSKEEVLTYGENEVMFSTIGAFFEAVKRGQAPPGYIGSASSIFTRNPSLEAMFDSPLTARIEGTLPLPEGKRSVAQLFVGRGGMTTQVHCDVGAAVFRQVYGSKQWVWFPPSEIAMLWPKLDPSGVALLSNTRVTAGAAYGREATESVWFRKLERYVGVVEAGDMIINPPWWWHAITNCPDSTYCPQAAATPFTVSAVTQAGHGESAFTSNPILTLNVAVDILLKWGSMSNFEEKFNRKHVVDGRDMFERSQVETSNSLLDAVKKSTSG